MLLLTTSYTHTHTHCQTQGYREMLAIKMTNKLFGTFALNRMSFKLRLHECV